MIVVEKGKSTNELINHIRSKHNINITNDRDKHDLLNMGYFSGYKTYRFVKTVENPLLISDFREIKDIRNLDLDLKALFYPVVMGIETAMHNYVIDAVVSNDYTDLESVLKNKLNHYNDFAKKSAEYKKAMNKYLDLKETLYGLIANRHKSSFVMEDYIYQNKPIPLWVIFQLTTLGELASFIECLNNDTKAKLSQNLGINDKRWGENKMFLPDHLDLIRNLRNAIAHNNPVFDCRFQKGKVKTTITKHLESTLAIKNLTFQSLTDYVLLLAYYMERLRFSKTDIQNFVLQYQKLVNDYKACAQTENYSKIFSVDAQSKIAKFMNSIK